MMPAELREAREAEAKAQRNLQRALKTLDAASRRRQAVEYFLRVDRRQREAAAATPVAAKEVSS